MKHAKLFNLFTVSLSGPTGQEAVEVGKPAVLEMEYSFDPANADEAMNHLKEKFGNRAKMAGDNPTLAVVRFEIPELTQEHLSTIKAKASGLNAFRTDTLSDGEERPVHSSLEQLLRDMN